MKDYLRQTDGTLRNDLREQWENKAVEKMLCHNNHAERPFAVVKEFWRMYPSLSLQNLSWLTHSIVNGTHRCAEVFGHQNKNTPITTRLAGIAITADPLLKRAVNKLCCVRHKSKGRVTILAREAHKNDKEAQVANRKRKSTEKHDAQIQKLARIAGARAKAEETLSTSLCTTVKNLDVQLQARCNNKESRISFLRDQIYARISGEQPRLYPNLGLEWRKAGGKIRISAPTKDQSQEDYLMKLVQAMIEEDSTACGINNGPTSSATQNFIRALPSIAEEYTNPLAIAYKMEYSRTIATLATPLDDPLLVELQEKYCGAILFDNETRASQKLYRIAAIQFVRSFSANRHSCWEATCEPVYRDSSSGLFVVPQEHKVNGSNVLLATALQGYALTEYPDGMEMDGVDLPWVDNYIAYFKNVIEITFKTTESESSVAGSSTPLQPLRSARCSRRSRIQTSNES